jgi:hypothetical protein
LALEIKLFSKIREILQRREVEEDIILEHKLVDLFCQVRKWEEKNPIKLSTSFDERVFENIKNLEIVNPNWKERILPYFLENKPMQYGITVALASVLAVVMISRSGTSVPQSLSDSAGVIIDNTSYLDKPSSVEYADSYHKRVFLEQMKQDPKGIETLSKLEAYYLSTGKQSVANEIRTFIEEARR